jgi:hypothetical protein
MPEPQSPQQVAQPSVSGFRIEGSRGKGASEVLSRLASISFLELAQEKSAVIAVNVESRDIQKNPYLFSIVYFKEGSIDVVYTVIPGLSPKKRRLEMIKHALNLLTILEDCYAVPMKQVYQLVEKAISDMGEYVSLDYDKLFSSYDSAKSEQASAKKKVKDLSAANEQLGKENYDLKIKNDELTLRVKSLETYTDSVLMLKIQEWINEHNGEINIGEFARVNGVLESRVEQILNRLVTEGYIESKKA